MKKLIALLLFIIATLVTRAQLWPQLNPRYNSYLPAPGEYANTLVYHDTLWDVSLGHASFVKGGIVWAYGGAHHWLAIDTAGNGWAGGLNATGALGVGSNNAGTLPPTMLTTDSLGNRLHFIYMNCSATNFGGYWASQGITTDSSLYVWGNTQGGTEGNGTYGCAASIWPVKVNFPAGVKIVGVCAGNIMSALDAQGNVWTWGGAGSGGYWNGALAQGPSPNYYTPTKITGISVPIVAISGADKWTVGLGSNGHLYTWVVNYYTDYVTYAQNQIAPNTAIDITSRLNLPLPIWKVKVNSQATYVLLTDSSAWGWGSNGPNGLGNGTGVDYNRYGCCPVPYGTGYPPATPLYYAFDQGDHEMMIQYPVRIAAGKHNFTDIFANTPGYEYQVFFLDVYNNLYAQGRNKEAIPNGIVPANYVTGPMQSNYPNSWDVRYIQQIFPFNGLAWQSPSPDCRKPSAQQRFPNACSIYTIPPHSAPRAVLNLSLVGGKIIADNRASAVTDGRYIQFRIMTQVSGPATLDMQINDCPVDTIATANGLPIPNGTYAIQLMEINDNFDTAIVTSSISINAATDLLFTLPTMITSIDPVTENTGFKLTDPVYAIEPPKFIGLPIKRRARIG